MKLAGFLILLELCFFLPIANRKSKENRCSSYTCGKVVHIQKQTKKRGLVIREYYIPIISYEANEIQYEILFSKNRNPDEYQVGDDFWIMYNPSDPTEVYQEDEFGRITANLSAFVGIWLIFLTLLWVLF